uniref:Uncharacterized protein n=1 Tax=Cynoglossus semilaevis TaxID=244447 RepID=A0A3P8USK9_CYNSE
MYDNLYLHGFEDSEAVSGSCSLCGVLFFFLQQHPQNGSREKLNMHFSPRGSFRGTSVCMCHKSVVALSMTGHLTAPC